MKRNLKFILRVLLFIMLIKNNSTIAQDLYISNGVTFELGGLTFELPGNWENHGTFISGTGTVIINGGTLQRITNPAGENFYDLKIEKDGTSVIFENDVHIESVLYVGLNNTINLNGNLIEMLPGAIMDASPGSIFNPAESGGMEITLNLNNISADIGGFGAVITTTANLGMTTIRRGYSSYSVNGMKSIVRYYDILPTNNNGLNATLVFKYLESELNGLSEDKLELFISTDQGVTWRAMGGIANPTENTVTVNGLDSFARFTLGTDLEAPTITLIGGETITVNRFSGQFIDPGFVVKDNYDSSPAIEITGSVNTFLPGESQLTYTATDKSGNTVNKIRNVKVIDDPAALTNPYLYFANKKLTLDKMNSVEGNLHSNGEINIKKGPVVYKSNLTAIGNVSIDKDITINGDVTTNSTLKADKNVLITGIVTEKASLEKVELPTFSFNPVGNDIKVAKNKSQILTPGNYSKVEVEQGATLEFSAGEFFIEELKLNQEVNLKLNISNGPITLNVKKNIDVAMNCVMTILPLGIVDSRYAKINTLGDIQIAKSSKILGTLCAPKGKIQLNQTVQLNGSLCAEEISIDKEVISLYHHVNSSIPLASISSTGESIQLDKNSELLEEKNEIPKEYELMQNYPNPFNPTTTIRFALPQNDIVKLEIFNLLGEKVITLVDGELSAGYYNFNFDARGFSSGVYVYRILTGNSSEGKKGFIETKKMILVK